MEGSIGWIKLYRSITTHWVFSDAHYFKAWIQILLTVNHKDGESLIQGELIKCKRGQSILSIKSWTHELGTNWSEKKIRTFFKLLEKDKMITIEGLKYTTKITILNYEKYQNKGKQK